MSHQLDERTLRNLVNAFPEVPMRVVAGILHAYLRQCETVSEAVEGARVRIADACAMEDPNDTVSAAA